MVNKRGRNYSQSNIEYMLELIEIAHPCGIDEWDIIASTFNTHFGNGENRSGDDLRNKFKALKNVRKPTGDPSIPPNVRRAKLAQKEIEARMCIQTLGGDVSDDDNESAVGGFPHEGVVDDNFRQVEQSDDNRSDDESHGGGSNDSMGSLNFDDDEVNDSVINYRQESTIQSESAFTPVDHPLRNHAHWDEHTASENNNVMEDESQRSQVSSPASHEVSQSSYSGPSASAGRVAESVRRSPRRVADPSDTRVGEPPVSIRVPVSGRFSLSRESAPAAATRSAAAAPRSGSAATAAASGSAASAPAAAPAAPAPAPASASASARANATASVARRIVSSAPAPRTGNVAPAPRYGNAPIAARSGNAGLASSVRSAVSVRTAHGSGVAVARRGLVSVGAAGRSAPGEGCAGRVASRGTSGSSQAVNTGRPPLPASSSVTTSRTGLTEDQLKDMSSTIVRSNTPSYSETVNKRRRLDNAIERNSDFLSRQDNDASGSGDNMMHLIMMQNSQRDARNDEYRHQELVRAERRQEEIERREELERGRQEQRREDQLEREENRRRDDLEREERREKSDQARSQMMFMFMNQKRNED